MDILALISKVVTAISKGVAIVDAVIKIIAEEGIEIEKLWDSDKE